MRSAIGLACLAILALTGCAQSGGGTTKVASNCEGEPHPTAGAGVPKTWEASVNDPCAGQSGGGSGLPGYENPTAASSGFTDTSKYPVDHSRPTGNVGTGSEHKSQCDMVHARALARCKAPPHPTAQQIKTREACLKNADRAWKNCTKPSG